MKMLADVVDNIGDDVTGIDTEYQFGCGHILDRCLEAVVSMA
jgi:hypothetical protein